MPPAKASDAPVAAPISGVVSVGVSCITNVVPVPVCAPIAVALPVLVIGPVRSALVVTVAASVALPAVSPAAVPVRFVATPAEGVPRSGVTSVGDVFITNVVPVPVCDATDVASPTLVIGPVRFPAVGAAHVVTPAPSVLRNCPLLPPEVGNVIDHAPATAAGCTVTLPLVPPAMRITPAVVPAVPRSNSAPGELVPMPKLPVFDRRARSRSFV